MINPDDKVEVYSLGDKEVLNNPKTLEGEDVLLKLTVDLADLVLGRRSH